MNNYWLRAIRDFRVIALLFPIVLCICPRQAEAQWVVTDPGHTALTYAGWIKELIAQGQQYAQQIMQYQKQVL